MGMDRLIIDEGIAQGVGFPPSMVRGQNLYSLYFTISA